MPIGPAPAMRAVPPASTPLRDTACHATAIGSTSAPIRRSTFSGSTCSFDASTVVNSAIPPPCELSPWNPIFWHTLNLPRWQAAHSPQ